MDEEIGLCVGDVDRVNDTGHLKITVDNHQVAADLHDWADRADNVEVVGAGVRDRGADSRGIHCEVGGAGLESSGGGIARGENGGSDSERGASRHGGGRARERERTSSGSERHVGASGLSDVGGGVGEVGRRGQSHVASRSRKLEVDGSGF